MLALTVVIGGVVAGVDQSGGKSINPADGSLIPQLPPPPYRRNRGRQWRALPRLRLQSQKELHNKLVTSTIKVEGALSLLGGKVTKTCCSMIAFYLFIYFF